MSRSPHVLRSRYGFIDYSSVMLLQHLTLPSAEIIEKAQLICRNETPKIAYKGRKNPEIQVAKSRSS